VSWSGAATGIALTAQVTMSDPQTVTATWRTQYEVTVVTSPAGVGQVTLTGCESVAGDWWCDVGDSVQVSIAAELQSAGKTYKFVSWTAATGDAAGGSATVSGPLDIVATFREAGLLENVAVLGSIIAIIVAAIVIALFLLWRRKKEPEEAPAPVAGAPLAPTGPMPPPPPPTMAPGTMECPSCGLTIEAKTGPCPICGTEVVAPAAPARDERIGRLEEAYKSGRISKEQYQANLKKMRGNT
jgi:predicted RNA-binding Zn-ribbon protein involved in translation (DUF1610 family)